MPRKIFSLVFIFFFLLSTYPPQTNARLSNLTQTTSDPKFYPIGRPDYVGTNQLPLDFLGQKHLYTVNFRGNGEAIVTGKFIFANSTDQPMTDYSFKLPSNIHINDLVLFQQETQGACVQYSQPSIPDSINFNDACTRFKTVDDCNYAQKWTVQCSWYDCVKKCLTTGTSVAETCAKALPATCVSFSQPDNYNAYLSGNSNYVKLKYELKDNEVFVTLDPYVNIYPKSYGSIVFYMRANGFAKKNIFGAYDYKFQTFLINDKIYNLQVGITADTDLILKDAKGKINYQLSNALPSIGAPDLVGKESSVQLNNYYSQIGLGEISKTANNLQSGESYTVKGSFADSNLRLNAKDILLGIFLGLIVLGIIIISFRLIYKNYKSITPSSNDNSQNQNLKIAPNMYTNLLEVAGGTFAASLVFSICVLVYILVNKFSLNSYGSYSEMQVFRVLINLILGLLLLIVELIALIGPIVYFWKKKGTTWGIVSILFTILWFVLYLIGITLIFFPSPPSFPTPMIPTPGPMMF